MKKRKIGFWGKWALALTALALVWVVWIFFNSHGVEKIQLALAKDDLRQPIVNAQTVRFEKNASDVPLVMEFPCDETIRERMLEDVNAAGYHHGGWVEDAWQYRVTFTDGEGNSAVLLFGMHVAMINDRNVVFPSDSWDFDGLWDTYWAEYGV